MKFMKAFSYIMLVVAAFVSGNISGYQAATSDAAASVTYAEIVTAYNHLEMVKTDGESVAHQTLIDNMAATLPRHKKHITEQSFLSEQSGPNNEVLMVTNRAETYAGVKAFIEELPDFTNKKEALDALKELQ